MFFGPCRKRSVVAVNALLWHMTGIRKWPFKVEWISTFKTCYSGKYISKINYSLFSREHFHKHFSRSRNGWKQNWNATFFHAFSFCKIEFREFKRRTVHTHARVNRLETWKSQNWAKRGRKMLCSCSVVSK